MADESLVAPHGRDANGIPLAPFGLKVDGNPKKSRQGAQRGQSGNRSKTVPPLAAPGRTSTTDRERRQALLELGDAFVINGLIGLSMAGPVVGKLGQDQADAFAGDAVILANFMAPLVDQVIGLSQDRPYLLNWLDGVQDNAPFLGLGIVLMQLTKAITGNHMRPDRELADAGRLMGRIKAVNMAMAIREQARAMGLSDDQFQAPEPPAAPQPQAEPEPAPEPYSEFVMS